MHISGAILGLGYQCFTNTIRKLPVMHHPWEHVLCMGVGAYAATEFFDWEERMKFRVAALQAESAARNAEFQGLVGPPGMFPGGRLPDKYYPEK
mmetsp:Transcript_33791/g.40835  ORF Transcript_33791/g.40835 Transcript_33791/m.40835 type:complete len:94 (-) Transcript_33791:224-505(-)